MNRQHSSWTKLSQIFITKQELKTETNFMKWKLFLSLTLYVDGRGHHRQMHSVHSVINFLMCDQLLQPEPYLRISSLSVWHFNWPTDVPSGVFLDVINGMWFVVWGERIPGLRGHNFPRAIAAFRCTVVLLASPAAWRSSTSTISVPSRLLAVCSNSRQWAKHRAALTDTISSQLEHGKWRRKDSSVWWQTAITLY